VKKRTAIMKGFPRMEIVNIGSRARD